MMKMKKLGGDWIWVDFKYERLIFFALFVDYLAILKSSVLNCMIALLVKL